MRKVFFIIVILGSLLSGCSTTWHVNKAREKCPDCFKQDTTITNIIIKRDTIIRLDTNILIFLPRDTFMLDIPIEDLRRSSFETIKSKDGIINTEVSVRKGIVHVISYLDSAIIYRFQDTIRIKDAIISNQREVIVEQGIIIKKERSLKERFKSGKQILLYILIGIIVLIVFGLGLKYTKWIIKLFKK